MDPGSDEQTQLLRNIWQEMKALGQNLGARIGETNVRLEQLRVDLGKRIDETNARLDQTNARLDKVEETLGELARQQVALTRVAARRRLSAGPRVV